MSDPPPTNNSLSASIIIRGDMTAKNRCKTSKWYGRAEQHQFAEFAVPGDLVEFWRPGFQHWGVYAGLCKPQSHQLTEAEQEEQNVAEEPHLVHLGFDTDAPSEVRCKDTFMPTVAFNPLAGVAGKSYIRVNNTDDMPLRGKKPATDIVCVNERIQNFINDNKVYEVVGCNCEDFAKYCRYGMSESYQAALGLTTIAIIAVRCIVEETSHATTAQLISLPLLLGLALATFVIGLGCLAALLTYTYLAIRRRRQGYAVTPHRTFPDGPPNVSLAVAVFTCITSIYQLGYILFVSLILITIYTLHNTTIWFMGGVNYAASEVGSTFVCWTVVGMTVTLMVGMKKITCLLPKKFVFYNTGLVILLCVVLITYVAMLAQPTFTACVLGVFAGLGMQGLTCVVTRQYEIIWVGVPAFGVAVTLTAFNFEPTFTVYMTGVVIAGCLIGTSYLQCQVKQESKFYKFVQGLKQFDGLLICMLYICAPSYTAYAILIFVGCMLLTL